MGQCFSGIKLHANKAGLSGKLELAFTANKNDEKTHQHFFMFGGFALCTMT